jgi:hypothetical protein
MTYGGECFRRGVGGFNLIGVFVMDGPIRVRTAAWFATAVVVSVFATLLVMQEWRADAAPGDSDATWVAVEPCRLFDYRPGKEPLDGKKTPLAAGAPATQQVTGNVGNCTIPTVGVVAVSMNVTIVSPTAQSNLRLYPADAASEPVVSNLNWLAGDSATANKVDVKLSSTGAVKVAVANGEVNVLGDLVGYYTNTTLKELGNKVPFTVTAEAGPGTTALTLIPTNYVTVEVTAPVAGKVTVSSYATIGNSGPIGSDVACKILESAEADGDYFSTDNYVQWVEKAASSTVATLNGTRTFTLAAGETKTYGLRCIGRATDDGTIHSRILTAIFTPTP